MDTLAQFTKDGSLPVADIIPLLKIQQGHNQTPSLSALKYGLRKVIITADYPMIRIRANTPVRV